MIKWIRHFQQPLLISITVLIIIAFVWLYNDNTLRGQRSNVVARIYDRPVLDTELGRNARTLQLSQGLMLMDLLMTLYSAGGASSDDVLWNYVVLRHEADVLGIVPTELEIEARIKALPMLQTAGQFDPAKYTMFLQNQVTPRGLSDAAVETAVGDDLKVKRLKELLGTTASASATEVRAAWEQKFQKVELGLARLTLADFEGAITLGDEEIQKVYEEKKAGLLTPEKRKVRFVAFTVPVDPKAPMQRKERNEAMSQLVTKAQNLSVALAEPGSKLDELATAAGAEVKESPEFAMGEPPAEFGGNESVAKAAFDLTKEQPNSDAILGRDGYYLVQLAEVIPPRQRTFEEAKAEITAQVKSGRALEQMTARAGEVEGKLKAAVAEGKPFAAAAEAAGVKAEMPTAFAPNDPKLELPDAPAIVEKAADLQEGGISNPVTTPTGVVFVYLQKRQPFDESEFEAGKVQIAKEIEDEKRDMIFSEWLKSRRKAANVQLTRN